MCSGACRPPRKFACPRCAQVYRALFELDRKGEHECALCGAFHTMSTDHEHAIDGGNFELSAEEVATFRLADGGGFSDTGINAVLQLRQSRKTQ